MYRFFTVLAFASLTVHASVISTKTVNASNGSCAASGADGCSCQEFVCDTDGVELTCNNNTQFYQDHGCMGGGADTGLSYQVTAGADTTICSTSGPLVGAGCSSGLETFCKVTVSCGIDEHGYCGIVSQEEGGLFSPCNAAN